MHALEVFRGAGHVEVDTAIMYEDGLAERTRGERKVAVCQEPVVYIDHASVHASPDLQNVSTGKTLRHPSRTTSRQNHVLKDTVIVRAEN